jgi:hypothetical protein
MNSHSYVYWSLGKANIHVDKEVNLLRTDSVVWTLGVLCDGSYLCFHYTVLTGKTNFGSYTTTGAIIFATRRIPPNLSPVLKLHCCHSKLVRSCSHCIGLLLTYYAHFALSQYSKVQGDGQ